MATRTPEHVLELAMSMILVLFAESLMESTSGFQLEIKFLMHLPLLSMVHGRC
jgi:hypothetical protein